MGKKTVVLCEGVHDLALLSLVFDSMGLTYEGKQWDQIKEYSKSTPEATLIREFKSRRYQGVSFLLKQDKDVDFCIESFWELYKGYDGYDLKLVTDSDGEAAIRKIRRMMKDQLKRDVLVQSDIENMFCFKGSEKKPAVFLYPRVDAGKIGYGEWGTEEDIIDVETLNIAFHKMPNQATLINYYFLLHIPKKSEIGYLILQRIQNGGIQAIFSDIFRDIAKTELPKYSIEVGDIFPKGYIEKIRQKLIPRELRLTAVYKTAPSGDIADSINDKHSIQSSTTTIEHVLKGRSGNNFLHLRKIFEFFLMNKDIPDYLLKAAGLPAEYEHLSFVIVETTKSERGKNRQRTLNIDTSLDEKKKSFDLESTMLPYHDITESVEYGADGYPTFESIDREARKYLQQLISSNVE